MDLFRSFLIRSRRDIKDIFEQIASESDMHWQSESLVANETESQSDRNRIRVHHSQSPQNNIATDHHLSAITSDQSNANHSESSIDSNHKLLGLLARNTSTTDRNNADTYHYNQNNTQSTRMSDAIKENASNSNATVDALKSLLLTATDFHAFIITYQCENLSIDDVRQLIQTHEPSAQLRQNNCLSFEGFARYLMDKDNYAYTPELQPIVDADMNQPLSHYYMASSHNTYLTGHQLKGESSVELYSQVLLTGCRCVELDCWDGDDGMPVIYHGHTLTSKIAFKKVIETINDKAFIASPYPVILSIENHCSLQQQQKMAQIFLSIFGDKLVTRFLFDCDYSDEPQLPTPNQLKHRILIKNKKLRAPFAPMLSMKTRANTLSKSLTSTGRTNSLISNASSGSLNEEEDDEYDDEDEDEETLALDDITPLTVDSNLVSDSSSGQQTVTNKNVISKTDSQSSQDSNSASYDPNKIGKGFGFSSPSPGVRPRSQSEDRISGELCNESTVQSTFYRNKAARKSSSQLAPELSDLVIYCQSIKFRSFISSAASPTNQTVPTSVIKKITTRKQGVLVPSSSTHTSFPSTSSVPAVTELSRDTISHSPTLFATTSSAISTTTSLPLNKRPTISAPCYQISSVNENTAKKLCRKNPLSLIAHTESQIMRTYPARIRIDSSNFNPVIFWAFGFQSVALNYQTVDTGLHINTAMFEQNGGCGLVLKPSVMRDKCHMMYGRFNPWVKELDGFYAINLTITIISGQYVCPNLNTGSPQVEIEIIGIPIDCSRQRTKVIQRNAINPIWNDTFLFRVCFRDLAFLRFAVTDIGSNHLTAQRVVPFNCLKQGYRHLKLKSVQNQILPLSTLFIYSSWETDGIDMASSASEDNMFGGVQTACRQKIDLNRIESREIVGSAPVRRRMFFLVVHGVVSDEPTTILKVTQESTSSDVITQALTKANKVHESANDYVLIEEVQRGWQKKSLFNRNTTTQRVLDCDERPLEAQSMWKGKGRFILKKIADNHGNRASLPNIRRINRQDTDSELNAEWNEDPENNTFLVCIYNVSEDQPYIILKANTCSRSQDIIAQALLKVRRLENANDFAIIEELENYCDTRFDAASICNKLKGTKSVSNNNTSRRVLEDNENIYSVQSKWKTKGKFELKNRNDITSNDMTLNRSKGSLKKLSEFHRSLSKKILRKEVSSATPIASCSAPHSLISSSCLESCGPADSPLARQIHSEGEMTSDNEEKKSASQMSRLKKLSIRRLKVWI